MLCRPPACPPRPCVQVEEWILTTVRAVEALHSAGVPRDGFVQGEGVREAVDILRVRELLGFRV